MSENVSRATPFESIPARIEAHGRATPDAVALQVGRGRATWRELGDGMRQVASALRNAQILPGERVALLGPASTAYVEALLGAVAARACVVPLPTSATVDTVEALLADSGARLLFVDAEAGDALGTMAARLSSAGKLQIIALGSRAQAGEPYAAWRGAGRRERSLPDAQPDDPFNIIYSSGTTGIPKGIVHRHAMRQLQAARTRFGYSSRSRTLLSTPMYSNTTLLPLLATLWHGGTSLLMPKFDVLQFLALTEDERATHTMLVPVQYKRLLEHEAFDGRALSTLEVSQCTGAPLDVALKERILARWPGRFLEVYGLTEGGVTCILDGRAHPDKLGTVGQPVPGSEVFLIDEDGRRLPRDATSVGEVVGRSDLMMIAYHQRPDATAQLEWHDDAGRRHFRSGDIGRFDADGFLTLLDRIKDVIISGGHNVYATDLEAVLSRHPAVADAAVIGVPSGEWGETPLALVKLRAEVHADADELRDWVNARVGKTQRVSAVEIRSDLARSALGKLSKKALRAPYWPAPQPIK